MDDHNEINAIDTDNMGMHLRVDGSDGADLGDVSVADELETITPKVGMEFPSQEEAYNYYNRYALKIGFGIRWSTTHLSRSDPTLVISRRFVCGKQGKSKPLNDGVGNLRVTRVDCKAMMKIVLTSSQSWKVSKFIAEHATHELSTPSKVVKHFSHKKAHRQPIVKDLMNQLHSEGISNANIARIATSFEPDSVQTITPQQVHDHLRGERKNNLGKNCAHVVRHFMEKKTKDPQFYSSIEVDDDMTLRSVVWADGRSQEAYKEFGDIVIFDVTYRTNNLCLPFAPFTGINHHRQSTLFGCALLADETEETFKWLFQEWLTCMGGKAPKAIITDQDAAIGNAIAEIFPETVHRYCDWHLDRKIAEHMVHLIPTHGPEIELWFKRLRTSSSESEAENIWKEMMMKYKFQGQSWLPRLWAHRKSWIHCYFKDTFLAGTRTSQRSESMNSFFDKFVHASTPLHEFVLQYDKALASRRRAEEDEDFRSMESTPVPTLQWPLEVHAGMRYTRALFTILKQEMKDGKELYWPKKVRKENMETIFLVGRPGTDENTWKTVCYNKVGNVISCECKHFQYVGLLCRHALCVYWNKMLTEIPECYILKRWTLDARYRPTVVDMGDCVRVSQVDRDRHWGIRYKCNKAVELAYKSHVFAEEFERFLTTKLAEYDNVELLEDVNVSSEAPNVHVEASTPHLSQSSSNLTPLINIRDPTALARTKGRPKSASRLQSGLEQSQQQSAIKRRKCGHCGELGHYITSCSKAKEDGVAPDGSQSQMRH